MDEFNEAFELNGGILRVVPAVHFRTPFAARVNLCCRTKDTRPEAIAVELGPGIAQYVYEWFQELHVDNRLGRQFPCMLAVAAHNSRIRPSMQKRAVSLQEETGQNLEELSPEILNKVLGYSSESILFLSPADSIIEAIRSAVELGIPVYGVDLEEVADPERQEILIRDTGDVTALDVPRWVGDNLDRADACRDEIIDGRRETAMAARLKTVLGRHGEVLFTCGAAHWLRIQQLLLDDAISPAIVGARRSVPEREYVRLVVHPSLAINYLDPFPPWVAHVEKDREPATREWGVHDLADSKFRPRQMFQALLEDAYREFLQQSVGISVGKDRKKKDDYEIQDFTTLLDNLSTLENRSVPDLFSMFSAARGTISSDFQDILAKTFFQFEWVDPGAMGLPILFSIRSDVGSRMKVQVVDTNGKKGKSFYLNDMPGYGETTSRGRVPCPKDIEVKYAPEKSNEPSQLPPRLDDKDESDTLEGVENLRTWDPTDDMFALMCCRAMTLTRYIIEQNISMPFEGPIHDGICIKSMIRAEAAGDDRIYVKQRRRSRGQPEVQEKMLEPIVWVFDPDTSDADWTPYSESLFKLKEHCELRGVNPEKLDSIANEFGDSYVAGMTYGKWDECAQIYERAGIVYRINLRGVLYFIPPLCNESEDLEWMRQADFSNVPIVNGSGIDAIVMSYRERYDINLNRDDWVSTMIGLAIPFARKTVVLVASPGFAPDQSILRVAERFGKRIAVVPLSYFSDSVVTRLQTNYGVRRKETSEGEIFNPLAVSLLGEEPDRFRHKLPEWLCDRVGRSRQRVSGQ